MATRPTPEPRPARAGVPRRASLSCPRRTHSRSYSPAPPEPGQRTCSLVNDRPNSTGRSHRSCQGRGAPQSPPRRLGADAARREDGASGSTTPAALRRERNYRRARSLGAAPREISRSNYSRLNKYIRPAPSAAPSSNATSGLLRPSAYAGAFARRSFSSSRP
jgi:hypothetical protein